MITPSKAESGVCGAPPWQNQSAELPPHSAPAQGLRDLIPSTELPPEQPDISPGYGTAPVLCLERGPQGFCAQQPIPPVGKEDSPTTHSELVFSLFPTSWQQAGGVPSSDLDMFGYGSSCSHWTETLFPSAPPGAEGWKELAGPCQGWAGAGASQGLPQCPEVGSVPETSNFQGSIC